MAFDIATSSPGPGSHPVRWNHSSWYNVVIIGLCNLCAPGIWVAMNSLGAGGAARPYLINAANALTFSLMVVSCFFSSVLVKYIGIKGALIFGTLGYAPYAAGLYTNNRFGTEWLVLVGAAACGVSAGVFWMAEAAIAIAYPEPWNKGKAVGLWLTFRGQIIGGAVNLALNADRAEAGKVSYTVFLVFIAIQAAGPLVALFLNKPEDVDRTDGKKVELQITRSISYELKATAKTFITKKFLLVLLFIGQAVYSESVYFTYLSLYFSVRARALGSFVSSIIAVTSGNLLGTFLDRTTISLRLRSRLAFISIVAMQGGWWIWLTILSTRYENQTPTPNFDWLTPGFGPGFAIFLFMTLGFQLNYIFFYFIIQNLATNQEDVIRYSALLRGAESAFQALSYGFSSIEGFAGTGQVYTNFSLYAVSVVPAWFVVKEFGSDKNGSSDEEATSSNSGSEEKVGVINAVVEKKEQPCG